MTTQARNHARVIPLRPAGEPLRPAGEEPAGPTAPAGRAAPSDAQAPPVRPVQQPVRPVAPASREPLWRDVVGDVLRRERRAQGRTLKEVSEAARISMPYLSELERGRKEASSEVLAAAARALGLGLADLLDRVRDEVLAAAEAVRPVSTVSHLGRGAATTARPSSGSGPSPAHGEVRLAA